MVRRGSRLAPPLARLTGLTPRLGRTLLGPFLKDGRCDVWLVVVYAVVNGLVLLNAVLHDPAIGYDATQHLAYVRALARLRLVTETDSLEFFSPPLPYLVPALAKAALPLSLTVAAKVGQLVNVALSFGLTFFLLETCKLLSPARSLRLGTLAFLGILTVYYKTFAFVRGEPYVAFFAVLALHRVTRILLSRTWSARNLLLLGAWLGLCGLSRQWGLLLLPAVFLTAALEWLRLPRLRGEIAIGLALCMLAAGLSCGWFYAALYHRSGSLTAFNRTPAPSFSLSNQPASFYVDLSPRALVSAPVQPGFPNRFWPIFYSEVWGDYWTEFSVYGRDLRDGTYLRGARFAQLAQEEPPEAWFESNVRSFRPYLGRVNLVSLFPTLLGAAAVIRALMSLLRRSPRETVATAGHVETESGSVATEPKSAATEPGRVATESEAVATGSRRSATQSVRGATQSERGATQSVRGATQSVRGTAESRCGATETVRGATGSGRVATFALGVIAFTMAGYGWFLIRYPMPLGHTIKASYVLQLFPFLALLVGLLLERLEHRSPLLVRLGTIGLALVALHNLPAMITHYRG